MTTQSLTDAFDDTHREYIHVYELHPDYEQRTCRSCGETRWFHRTVSNRWPHWDCDDLDGFSKPGAIPDDE